MEMELNSMSDLTDLKKMLPENSGKYDDVFVIRDGQKLTFDEVASFEPKEETAAV